MLLDGWVNELCCYLQNKAVCFKYHVSDIKSCGNLEQGGFAQRPSRMFCGKVVFQLCTYRWTEFHSGSEQVEERLEAKDNPCGLEVTF